MVSEDFKQAIKEPAREIKSKIELPGLTLDDENIVKIDIDSSFVFGEDFEIGTAPMDTCKIELIEEPDNPIVYNFEDKESNIQLGIRLPDESIEYVSIGKYTVEKVVKKNNKITLDCVDRMYKAEKEFINNLMFPTTILEILQSACEQSGITLKTLNFANADYVVPNEPVFENITCRHIFAQVAELAGGYAKINRDGELEILTLGDTVVREITKDHYFELKQDEVSVGSIDRVIVKVGEETAEQGEGENIYTIVDNMFVQNPNDVVEPIYDVLKNVNYASCDFNWQGDFSLDLGDKIIIDGHETYILDRKLKYTGGLREDYKAPAKSNVERNSTGKSNLLLDMNNIKTQIKVIEGEISQTIEKVENLVVDAENRLYQSQTQIPFDLNQGRGTLQLFREAYHPYYKVVSDTNIDLSAAFPQSQYAEDLTGEEVTISLDVLVDVDRVVTLDGKEFEVKGNRWTRIHVTKEFPENSTVNKRVRIPYSRKITRDKIIGNKLIDSLSTDINTIYYRNLQVQKGDVPTNWTLTPEELEGQINRYQSEIRQLADEISLTVKKGDIISEINQTAEQVRISADKIKLEGAVTANENFKVLEDGSIETKNAYMENAYIEGDVVSENADIKGNINAETGKVAGFNISGSNLVGNDVSLEPNKIKFGTSEIEGMGATALALKTAFLGVGNVGGTLGNNAVIQWNTNNDSSVLAQSLAGSTKVFADDFVNTSDIRHKKIIQDIPMDLMEQIANIKPRMYEMKGKIKFGYVAQDVEREIIKWCINTTKDLKLARELSQKFAIYHKNESYLSLLYNEIFVMKEMATSNKINEMEERIEKLEKIINSSVITDINNNNID